MLCFLHIALFLILKLKMPFDYNTYINQFSSQRDCKVVELYIDEKMFKDNEVFENGQYVNYIEIFVPNYLNNMRHLSIKMKKMDKIIEGVKHTYEAKVIISTCYVHLDTIYTSGHIHLLVKSYLPNLVNLICNHRVELKNKLNNLINTTISAEDIDNISSKAQNVESMIIIAKKDFNYHTIENFKYLNNLIVIGDNECLSKISINNECVKHLTLMDIFNINEINCPNISKLSFVSKTIENKETRNIIKNIIQELKTTTLTININTVSMTYKDSFNILDDDFMKKKHILI